MPLWLQITVAVFSIVGAVLGVFNFIRSWQRVKVSLGEAGDGSPALIVVNHSSFPIEIVQVGHSLQGSEAPLSLDRILHPYPENKVIGARSRFCFSVSSMDTLHRVQEQTDYFYATTATGTTYTTESRTSRWKRRAAELLS